MGAKANLLIYLEKKNIKKPDFYRITGASNGFLDKNDGISSALIETIAEKFSDLSIDWLITGNGDMLRNNLTNHSIIGSNKIQNSVLTGDVNNSNIDARQYYSDSPDVLRAQIEEKDRLLEEKECRIKEKDAQIKEKDAQIGKLLGILEKD